MFSSQAISTRTNWKEEQRRGMRSGELEIPKSNLNGLKYVMMALNGMGERLWQFQVTEGTLSINGRRFLLKVSEPL